MAPDPVGGLIVRLERKRGGTAEAPCGCRVRVTFFTSTSYAYAAERCNDHPIKHYPADQ